MNLKHKYKEPRPEVPVKPEDPVQRQHRLLLEKRARGIYDRPRLTPYARSLIHVNGSKAIGDPVIQAHSTLIHHEMHCIADTLA